MKEYAIWLLLIIILHTILYNMLGFSSLVTKLIMLIVVIVIALIFPSKKKTQQ